MMNVLDFLVCGQKRLLLLSLVSQVEVIACTSSSRPTPDLLSAPTNRKVSLLSSFQLKRLVAGLLWKRRLQAGLEDRIYCCTFERGKFGGARTAAVNNFDF